MTRISNAELLDKLLDQWELDATTNKGILNYFQTIVGLPGAGAAPAAFLAAAPAAAPTLNDIQDKIKKLYLVFHYPQYTAGTTKPTVFDPKDTTNKNPSIIDTHGIFNYVLPEPITGFTGKRLLSSAGIPKKDMINLKMVIDKIATATTEPEVIKLLFTDEYDITSTLTMGGNNSTDIIIPKNTGGKNNRSNKRIKKLRKRNKSSKSMK